MRRFSKNIKIFTLAPKDGAVGDLDRWDLVDRLWVRHWSVSRTKVSWIIRWEKRFYFSIPIKLRPRITTQLW